MAKKSSDNFIGGWAFLIGVILAIIIPLFSVINPTITIILVVIGLIVGLLNVTGEEGYHFMVSGIVLIIASNMGGDVLSAIPALADIFNALLLIFVPATIIVAIKNVFHVAHR